MERLENMEKEKVVITQRGKLIYAPGTIKQTNDGRKYIVAPDGAWRRIDKLQKKWKSGGLNRNR